MQGVACAVKFVDASFSSKELRDGKSASAGLFAPLSRRPSVRDRVSDVNKPRRAGLAVCAVRLLLATANVPPALPAAARATDTLAAFAIRRLERR